MERIKEITSTDHVLVKHWMKLKSNGAYRHEHKRVLIEGEKLVKDCVPRMTYHHMAISSREMLPAGWDKSHVTIVSEEILKKISGWTTPPKMIAEVDLPPPVSLKGKKWILALDRVQDPGNVGTLVRTALALGWEGVFLVEGTADLFNDKALRASQGASLLLPYQEGGSDDLLELSQNCPVYVADMAGVPPFRVESALLVIGNEGQGVSEVFKQESFKKLSVPMTGPVESLNASVAGGILMFSLKGSL